MSKSIYEEALEDFQLVKYYTDKLTSNTIYHMLPKPCDNISNSLTLAEKQEKLLERYKKLSNLYEELYGVELSLLSLNLNYYETEIIKLKQQIKELEK